MTDPPEDDHPPDPPGPIGRGAVLAAFEDPEPLTAEEVAEKLGIALSSARDQLEALATAGMLGTKTVGAAGVELYYPTPGGNGHAEPPTAESGERSDTPDLDDATLGPDAVVVLGEDDDTDDAIDNAVEEAIAAMDVPGTSEMMRDWRRSAIRAAFDYLRDVGSATSAALRDDVYPGNPAGYDDADAWFDCVAPRLEQLPGVVRDRREWTYDP